MLYGLIREKSKNATKMKSSEYTDDFSRKLEEEGEPKWDKICKEHLQNYFVGQ